MTRGAGRLQPGPGAPRKHHPTYRCPALVRGLAAAYVLSEGPPGSESVRFGDGGALARRPVSERRNDAPTRGVRLDRRRFVLRYRTALPSTREAINVGVDEVLELARRAGFVGSDAADVEIALREALANAVIHGNGGRPERRILLRCYVEPGGGVLIAVRDEGDGFDPRAVPDPRERTRLELPHGRGIFLMRELMDVAEHRKGGREIVLFKGCAGARRARPGTRRR